MAATLGGVTLYLKYGTEGQQMELQWAGSRQEMADGSLVLDNVGYRHTFKLSMHGMTAAQKNAIKAVAVLTTAQAYVDLAGNNYTVVADPASWRERQINDATGTYYYEADLTLYETSVT